MIACRSHTCKVQVTKEITMSSAAFPSEMLPKKGQTPAIVQIAWVALAAWLAAVLALGASGVFVGAAGRPPLPVFAGAVVPVILFAIALRTSQTFYDFVLA